MIKIVVTRPVDNAKKTMELARQMGFSAFPLPLLKLTALKNIKMNRRISEYNWIVFTSSSAVQFFMEYYSRDKSNFIQDTKIAAIGPTTEKTLNSFNFKADFIPNIFNRTAVSKQMPVNKYDVVLYPTLQGGPTRIENILKQRGCSVERFNIYKSDSIIYHKRKWQELASVKAKVITFFSARTVRAFFDNHQQWIDLKDYVIAALSESSVDELFKNGYVAQIKANVPTAENLLQKIKQYYD